VNLDSVNTEVRRAQLDDCAAIAAVQVAGWRAAYRGLIPDAYLDGLEVDEQARKWAGILTDPAPGRRPAGRLLVSEDAEDAGGTIRGFVAFGPPLGSEQARLTEGQLYAIYADPQRWGLGVGHALIEAATVGLRGMGARTAHLWVLKGNERAEHFYLRHGWVLDGGRRDEEFGGVVVQLVR
jgi:ribosomal protein S18 acetylase RimI-like enzyme